MRGGRKIKRTINGQRFPFWYSALGLVSAVLAPFVVFAAWSNPSQNPPGGNASDPINTSLLGQVKQGVLSVSFGTPQNSPGFIVNDGRVGIGSSTPVAKLSIDDGAGIANVLNLGGDRIVGLQEIPLNWNEAASRYYVDYRVSVATSTETGWVWSGNNLYNTNTGNVGIGTTNPGAKLDIVGSTNISAKNLLYNGGFENGTFAAWDGGGFWIDISNTQSYSGSRSMRLNNMGGWDWRAAKFSIANPSKYIGKRLSFSLWMRGDTTNFLNTDYQAGSPHFGTNADAFSWSTPNGSNADAFTSSRLRDNNWYRYTGSFIVPAGTTDLYLSIPIWMGQTPTNYNTSFAGIFVDDVTVTVGAANEYSPVATDDYDNVSVGGNIGIKTASPGSALDVNGRTFLRGDAYQLMIGGITGGADFLLLKSGNVPAMPAVGDDRMFWIQHNRISATNFVENFWQKGDGAVGAQANGLSLYYNNGTASVGIGTSAPGSTLHVNGLTFLDNTSGSSYNENVRLHRATNQCSSIALGATAGSSGTGVGQWAMYSCGNPYTYQIDYNGAAYFNIDATGRVGIGTVSPGSLMELAKVGTGATSAQLALKSFTNGVGGGASYLTLSASRGATVGAMVTTQTDDWLGIIDGNGVNTSNTARQATRIFFQQDGPSDATYVPGRISFQTAPAGADAQERMRITSAGRVGISSSTPVTALGVEPSGQNSLSLGGGRLIGLQEIPLGWNEAASRYYVDYRVGIATSSEGGWAWSGNNLYNTNTGNVGIGTSAPASLLHLNGYEPTLTIRGTRDDASCARSIWQLVSESTTPGDTVPMSFFIKENGSAKITVTAGGNVGIGPTSPGARLDLGTGTGVKFLWYNDRPADAGGTKAGIYLDQFALPNNSTLVFAEAAANPGSFIIASKDTGVASFTLTPRVTVTGLTGRVGIGTTVPAAKLHVHESTALANPAGSYQLLARISGYDGGNIPMENIWLYRDAAGASNWFTDRIHNGISVDTSYLDPATSLVWWQRDPQHNIQAWGNAASTYLIINNGNIGIASSTPINLTSAEVGGAAVALNVGGYSRIVGLEEVPTRTNEAASKYYVDSRTGGAAGLPAPGTAGNTLYSNGTSWAASANIFNNNGNVGIGTNLPNQKLDIAGNTFIRGTGSVYNNAGSGELQVGYGFGAAGTVGSVTRIALQPYAHTGGPWRFVARDTASTAYLDFNYNTTNGITLDSSGNVGIGATAPGQQLEVYNALDAYMKFNANGAGREDWRIGSDNQAGGNGFIFYNTTDNLYRMVIGNSGNVIIPSPGILSISTTTAANFRLDVNGNARILGELKLGPGDVAENFVPDQEYPAGTVLVMAEGQAKAVTACHSQYDKTVVGVVSEKPAINMGSEMGVVNTEHGLVPIALVGVVKVKVNNSNGDIKKGDLLTTSEVWGEAMKTNQRVDGATIGKALENFSDQHGEILCLVNLQ